MHESKTKAFNLNEVKKETKPRSEKTYKSERTVECARVKS